jgi:hypothetical protein
METEGERSGSEEAEQRERADVELRPPHERDRRGQGGKGSAWALCCPDETQLLTSEDKQGSTTRTYLRPGTVTSVATLGGQRQ